ncbi:MAG: hypothetical protein WCX82_00265 [archaeon]
MDKNNLSKSIFLILAIIISMTFISNGVFAIVQYDLCGIAQSGVYDLCIQNNSVNINQQTDKCPPSHPYYVTFITKGMQDGNYYVAFVEDSIFKQNEGAILKYMYYKENNPSLATFNFNEYKNTGQLLIDASKFTILKNDKGMSYCLSSSFSKKNVDIFIWQYKTKNISKTIKFVSDYLSNNMGYNTEDFLDLGLGSNGSIQSYNYFSTNYNKNIFYNYEFSSVLGIIVPELVTSTIPVIVPAAIPAVTSTAIPAATEPPKITLEFNPNFYISEINYSTVASTLLKASKLRDNDSFVVDDKDKDKNFSIALPGFKPNTDVYAIIATPDKSTEIYTELAYILSKDKFESYSSQTNNYEIRMSMTAPLKQIFKLDAQGIFKFGIKTAVTNEKLVLILMQKSTDGRKINLAYTNLYLLDDGNQSLLSLCEINKRIVSFYCKGYNCNIPKSCIDRWDYDPKQLEGIVGAPLPGATIDAPPAEGTPTPPVTETPVQPTLAATGNCGIDKQATVEEYITCLRNNIETVNLTKSYDLVIKNIMQGQAKVGNVLINDKYITNTNNLCFTSSLFNNVVFSVAKAENLTEEETAQLWSRLAAESGCKVDVCNGYTCESQGVAQINVESWRGSYNLLNPYLIEIDSIKYGTSTKFEAELSNVKNNPSTAIEISIAINKYHKSVILNKSKKANRPFTDLLDKIYDHDDAIDMEFATAYTYTGVSYADHFVDGIKIGAKRFQGIVYPALHKMGYYLTYKHMIYQCHKEVTTNAFVTAYKTKYNGIYCK